MDFQFNAQYDNLTFDKSLQDAGLRTLIIFHFNLITNMFVLISIVLKVGPCLSVLNTVVWQTTDYWCLFAVQKFYIVSFYFVLLLVFWCQIKEKKIFANPPPKKKTKIKQYYVYVNPKLSICLSPCFPSGNCKFIL